MEYTIVHEAKGDILIAGRTEIKKFSTTGRRLYTDVPDQKMFRELCYLIPPVQVEAESEQEALRLYQERFVSDI